uniref:Thromboxane A2 receptor n=1 Tax=Cyprinus carpio TaxID=7962 RepID=A0A8C2IFT0_CYPCA
MDNLFTSSFPVKCQNSRDCNLTTVCPDNQTVNSTSPALVNPPAFGMSYFTMTLGALSNLTALAILAHSYARFRRRAKAPFLLLASALLLSDLAGHVITGALALHLHLGRVKHYEAAVIMEPPQVYCKLFGSCMVFFGLCPLLLGSAMAVERCIGITWPLLHPAVVTMTRIRLTVLLITFTALILAGLPLLNVGNYKPQFPGTWCFLPVNNLLCSKSLTNLLTVPIIISICFLQNIICFDAFCKTLPMCHFISDFLVCLTVFLLVSQIYILISVSRFYEGIRRPRRQCEKLLLLALRLASWNQILDPWVYILLRRAVLRRLLQLLQPDRLVFTHSGSYRDSHRKQIGLH